MNMWRVMGDGVRDLCVGSLWMDCVEYYGLVD